MLKNQSPPTFFFLFFFLTMLRQHHSKFNKNHSKNRPRKRREWIKEYHGTPTNNHRQEHSTDEQTEFEQSKSIEHIFP